MRIEPGGSTTISPVYKPTAPTTPSLATQYQEAVAAAAAKARDEEMRKKKPVTPVGFGVPGYWWQGMTPFIAPGGMAAPVMTAGNGSGYNAGALGITDPYAGVTGADPTTPNVDPTVPVEPTTTDVPPTETPPTDNVIHPPKPKNYSEPPAWAKKNENSGNDPYSKKSGDVPGGVLGGDKPWYTKTVDYFSGQGTDAGMSELADDVLNATGSANSGSGWLDLSNVNTSTPSTPSWLSKFLKSFDFSGKPEITSQYWQNPDRFGNNKPWWWKAPFDNGISSNHAPDLGVTELTNDVLTAAGSANSGSGWFSMDEPINWNPLAKPKTRNRSYHRTGYPPPTTLPITDYAPGSTFSWDYAPPKMPSVNLPPTGSSSDTGSGTGTGTGTGYGGGLWGGGYGGGGGGGGYNPYWNWNLINWNVR